MPPLSSLAVTWPATPFGSSALDAKRDAVGQRGALQGPLLVERMVIADTVRQVLIWSLLLG